MAAKTSNHSLSAQKEMPKRKEIYRYTAPWIVYAMNWSVRQDKRFRLAIASFIEDYCNKVRFVFINSLHLTFLHGVPNLNNITCIELDWYFCFVLLFRRKLF